MLLPPSDTSKVVRVPCSSLRFLWLNRRVDILVHL